MNDIQKRFLLFLGGCIPVRMFFAWIAKTINPIYLPYLGYLALLPAVGFFYIWFTGSRQVGAEVFGAKIWWNNLRPIHGVLYLIFAYNAIQYRTDSYKYLVADIIIGLASFLIFHYQANSFVRLLDRSSA
jgi:drug/metabolite transporter (DMT)-like permease